MEIYVSLCICFTICPWAQEQVLDASSPTAPTPIIVAEQQTVPGGIMKPSFELTIVNKDGRNLGAATASFVADVFITDETTVDELLTIIKENRRKVCLGCA